jgi:hypothetical protein
MGMNINEMLKVLGCTLGDLRCMSDDMLSGAFKQPILDGVFSTKDIEVLEYAVHERKATRWERVKFAAKRAVRKVGAALKTIGRKTVTALKTVGRFFRNHWGALVWLAVLGVGFSTVPVFTAIALGSIFLVILSVLSGVVVTAAYNEHSKKNQPGMWTADADPATSASN